MAYRNQWISQQPQQQQMFRVRDAAQKTQGANVDARSPNGLNNSKFPASATELLTQDAVSAPALAATSGGGPREGAKPFLDQLFEDFKSSGEGDESGANTFDGRVPGGSYHEQVRRQWAKPNILQSCVSTDAVPLPTITGPVNYTTFSMSHLERPEDPPTYNNGNNRRGRVFSGMHAAVEMRKTRDALILMPNGALRPAGAAPGPAAAPTLSFYNESEELHDVHLKFLLSTIDQVKRRTNPAAVTTVSFQ